MRSTSALLSLWFFLFLASIAAISPFLSVVLEGYGASGATTALVLTVFPLSALLVAPLGTLVADRSGLPVRVLQVGLALSVGATTAMLFANSLVGIAVTIALLAVARAPISSIADMLTVDRVGMKAGGYPVIRAWGSAGFIAAAAIVGLFIDSNPRLPIQLGAGLLAAVLLLSFWIPGDVHEARPTSAPPLKKLLSNRLLLALYAVAILHQGTLSYYDYFFALHVRQLGLGSWVTGLSIAVGVTIEIVALTFGHRLLQWFRPLTLVAIAASTGIPRWILTSEVSDPLLLVTVQSFHGIGFGFWWVGAIALIDRHSPAGLRNTGQGLLMAAAYGVGSLLTMATAGLLLDRVGGSGVFLVLAAASTCAAGVALGMRLLDRSSGGG